MITRELIESIRDRLRKSIANMAVELFPEKPDEYRLNHPNGAILVSYRSSKFEETNDITYVVQPRRVVFTVSVLRRQLNGNTGILDVLDAVRLALTGFKGPNCRRKFYVLQEIYLGETAGIWQYSIDFATELMQVEEAEEIKLPVLTVVNYEESND
ncbi:Gp37 family protein [Oligella urethralis]|uniref:Gp37 family protein n=1 Tax=Oligella urethralis TaxID=90245 RepID=UPI000E018241|nr:Gp37 family protein [Oligella urethralis]SUA58104.1 Gp37 protein [Oligella urethralis]